MYTDYFLIATWRHIYECVYVCVFITEEYHNKLLETL